jgi:hypothetical protein
MEGKPGEEIYGNAIGDRLEKKLSTIMRKEDIERLAKVVVHHDPNFRYLTYGDKLINKKGNWRPRGKKIAGLKPDNLLVFCASLQNYEKSSDRGLFIIGYFTIEEVHDFSSPKFTDVKYRSEVVSKFKDKTDHLSETYARAQKLSREELLKNEKNLVLVNGKEEDSGLLNKAIRITDENFVMPKFLVKCLGLKKEVSDLEFKRGWKTVECDYINNLRNLLSQGGDFFRK